MNKLILTGWGWIDYGCAAALALRKFPKADVRGMSTRRLPEFLEGEIDLRSIDGVVILGVGLSGDPARLEKALRRLKDKGVSLTWISRMSFRETLPDSLKNLLDIHVCETSVTHAVAEKYGLAMDGLTSVLSENRKDRQTADMLLLLEAAMYAYRNYQDTGAYGRAIAHLAKGDDKNTWTLDEQRMVADYQRYGHRELVGRSAQIVDLQEKITRVARHPSARVLVYGESGTGKETVALQIHLKSGRREEPFIAFNCASVTPSLLESRFLGHEKGAFTGATDRKSGVFEQADGGTLFLDEIGEMPLEAQGLLLRVLEGGRFTRLGGKDEVSVDVRLITATHRNLAAMVRDGKFREDLFHRLAVVEIRVPPLREHKEDIAAIANSYWLKQYRKRLEQQQIDDLTTYDYPGNVRELFNLLERASVLEQKDFAVLVADQRKLTEGIRPDGVAMYPDNLEEATRIHVRKVYEKCGKNISQAAEALGAARNTVKKYLDG